MSRPANPGGCSNCSGSQFNDEGDHVTRQCRFVEQGKSRSIDRFENIFPEMAKAAGVHSFDAKTGKLIICT